jgi:hypothetical protein
MSTRDEALLAGLRSATLNRDFAAKALAIHAQDCSSGNLCLIVFSKVM